MRCPLLSQNLYRISKARSTLGCQAYVAAPDHPGTGSRWWAMVSCAQMSVVSNPSASSAAAVTAPCPEQAPGTVWGPAGGTALFHCCSHSGWDLGWDSGLLQPMLMQLVALGELCSHTPIPQGPPRSGSTWAHTAVTLWLQLPAEASPWWNESGSVGAVAWLIGYFSGGV